MMFSMLLPQTTTIYSLRVQTMQTLLTGSLAEILDHVTLQPYLLRGLRCTSPVQ
jgi:hypothetical protein